MIELILVSENLEDEQRVIDSNVDNFYFTFLDIRSVLSRKQAYQLKSDWGAKENPFAVVKNKDEVLRCFYAESKKDVVDDALNFIKSVNETYD